MEKENPPPYSPYPPGGGGEPSSYPSGSYPAPPPGFTHIPPPGQPPLKPMHPPHPQPQHTVIVTTALPTHFGPNSQFTICPSCQERISTEVKTEPNTKTHLFALILCLFQCYCCCCIPYCVDSCQSQNHYCPNCHAYLGTYQN